MRILGRGRRRWLPLVLFGCFIVLLTTVKVDICWTEPCVPGADSQPKSGRDRGDSVGFRAKGTPWDMDAKSHTSLQTADNGRVALCQPSPRKIANCGGLFGGENTSISSNPVPTPASCRLENLVDNCDLLRRSRGYGDSPVTAAEEDFPLAFSVKLHTNPAQFEQLFRTIYRPQNAYCVHVDKRSDPSIHRIIGQISKCFDNVYVIEPVSFVYASFDHVRVELELMRTCLRHDRKWKYYINLTGKDFPLKTNLEMVEILRTLQGQNDIESFRLSPFRTKQFLRKVNIINNTVTITNQTKEPFRYKLSLRKGSTYGLFTRDFVNFLLNDNIARLFLDWSRDLTPAEEIVWATLNTLPWAPGGSEVEVRHVDGTHLAKAILWSLDSDACEGQVIRSVCVFGANDLSWLKDRHELFANKFDDQSDPVALDCLEGTLRRRSQAGDLGHLPWFRYRHLPQTRHLRRPQDVDPDFRGKSRFEIKKKWLIENGPKPLFFNTS